VIRPALAARAGALAAARTPFVLATVVRAQRPTSVRPGDTALVLGDGSIEGFVGGHCAEASVRLHALRALETGEPLLLRIVPEGPGGGPDAEGAVTVSNPCLSGGALELFLEPRLPAPRLVVVGETPIAAALAALGERMGWAVVAGSAAAVQPAPDDAALVVASHGHDEERALERALRDGVPYVGLVASRRRGAVVLAGLDVPDALCARVHTPAGLDIGARTAEEVALSILAEIVATRGAARPAAAAAAPEPATARDPVCGMEVALTAATPRLDGHAFCCEGCRDAYAADPLRYASAP
jgi:xanthine dehydrogenase accessory factor